MSKTCLWLFASFVLFAACKKNHDDQEHFKPGICGITTLPSDSTGYFAFGRAYGMCGGPDCAIFFKIQNGKIYADSMNQYNGTTLHFSSVPLSAVSYTHALTVLYMVPPQLYNTNDTTIGAPDSHDQGGYYIQYRRNDTSVIQNWRIDTDTAGMPDSIRNYQLRLEQVLDSLQ